ncbi:MAG: hypothetical protein M1166_07395 [Candidatus Thermoplasmatota archaeon]|nr:hypothetical protein [Candidatus Thermoplasmatota archaeon]
MHNISRTETATVKINPDNPMNRNPGSQSQAIIFRGSKIEFDINAYFLDLRRSVTELRRDIIRKNLADVTFAEDIGKSNYLVLGKRRAKPGN